MRAANTMTDSGPTLHVATAEDEPKEGALDRRESAWRDPRTWLTFAGLLLTVGTALLGFIASMLISISSAVKTTNDLVIRETTRQSAEIKALEDRLARMENAVDTQNKAYNFNFTTRLAGVEAALKLKPRTKPDDEE